jgi:hypothetical protein
VGVRLTEGGNGPNFAWVSLSASSDTLPGQELANLVPRARVVGRSGNVVAIEFQERDEDLLLETLLDRLHKYLIKFYEELMLVRRHANFRIRIGWTPQAPQESLVVPADLLTRLAGLNADVMLDGYG